MPLVHSTKSYNQSLSTCCLEGSFCSAWPRLNLNTEIGLHTRSNFKQRVLGTYITGYNCNHETRKHLSWRHLSISAIYQLLLARFGSNFKQRVLGTYTTDYNCHHDIWPGNICPGDICPYQQYKYFQAEHFRLQSCTIYLQPPPSHTPRYCTASTCVLLILPPVEYF